MALVPYKPLKPGQHPGEASVVRGTVKNPYLTDPGAWAAPTTPQAPIDPNWGEGVLTPKPPLDPNVYGPGAPGPGPAPGPVTHDPINVRTGAPDYSGILGTFDSDWQGKFNAALGVREAQRQSAARATINRLGIRDPNALMAQLQKYGLTTQDLGLSDQDLQNAVSNPWSDLKAIQMQADRTRGQGIGEYAARGGFRSGGTATMLEDTENARARAESQANETAMGALSQGKLDVATWGGDQLTQHEVDRSNLRGQLAQAYQPTDQQATWDAGQGGYRFQNTIYDQYGNVIRTV